MKKISSLIVKKRMMILIISLVLLIPSVFGYISTKINYDLLTYLPKEIDTMKGRISSRRISAPAHSRCLSARI